VADDLQKELRALLGIRRIRLQRAETALIRARQSEKRAAEEVVARQAAAEQAAIDNKARESALALELFNRKTVLSHIESFRRDVGQLRRSTSQALADVEVAKQNSQQAKVATREAVEGQRRAYRAVEKLEFSVHEFTAEATPTAGMDSLDA
jgi:DNA polymerase elongation subunit (family B)